MRSQKFKWFTAVVVALYFLTISLFYELPFGSKIFQDVTKDHYAVYEIEYMFDHGYMKGRDKDVWNFYPEAPMTRAELIGLILKIENVDLQTIPKPDSSKYRDVPTTHWALAAVAEADKLHLNPFQDTKDTFNPDKPVTRGELAQAVVQTLHVPVDKSGGQNLPDLKGSRYEDAIRTVVARNYAQGNSDGQFRPDEDANRAAVASLFAKALQDMRPELDADKKKDTKGGTK